MIGLGAQRLFLFCFRTLNIRPMFLCRSLTAPCELHSSRSTPNNFQILIGEFGLHDDWARDIFGYQEGNAIEIIYETDSQFGSMLNLEWITVGVSHGREVHLPDDIWLPVEWKHIPKY